jgi:Na+-driven multidrug efflux pump
MDKLRESVRTMQGLFLVIGLISGGAIYLCRDLIISIYNVQPETQELARQFITVLSVTVVGSAYQAPCLTGIVRGGGHTKFVFYNDLVFMWGIVLPLSFLGAFVWKVSPVLVFFFLKSDQLMKCIVAVFEVNSYRWVKKLTREPART